MAVQNPVFSVNIMTKTLALVPAFGFVLSVTALATALRPNAHGKCQRLTRNGPATELRFFSDVQRCGWRDRAGHDSLVFAKTTGVRRGLDEDHAPEVSARWDALRK